MDDQGGQVEQDQLAAQFEKLRPRLRIVAYRLLGTTTGADDAVQDAWIRLSRSTADPKADQIENLEGWLITTVSRLALNQLRARTTRREAPLDTAPTDAVAEHSSWGDPVREAALADSVGLALQVVLETLTPAERLAYVLHDMFAVPFDQIATILDRSPEAARQLASRGRRRIRGRNDASADPIPDRHPAERRVVQAFLAAARDGDFQALLEVLDPHIVQHTTAEDGSVLEVRGARAVAARAQAFAQQGLQVHPARVGGQPGWITLRDGHLYTVGILTLTGERITTMDIVFNPTHPEALNLTHWNG